METKQTGWLIIVVISVTILTWAILGLSAKSDGEHEMLYMYLFVPVMLIPALLFYQLTVMIDAVEIKIRFGIGLIRKSWKISDIACAAPVRNTLLNGWGIHYTMNTNIYNVSGMKAVELTFKNNRRKVRIGAVEPEKLADYINRIVSKTKP